MKKSILIASILLFSSACDVPDSEQNQKTERLMEQINDLEARVSKLEESASAKGESEAVKSEQSKPPPEPKRKSFVLLIDGNRGAVYGDRAGCEAAASKLQSEADREQARRDELNRIESEKPVPPGIIYGPAKRPDTQCIPGS